MSIVFVLQATRVLLLLNIYTRLLDSAFLLPFLLYILEPPEAMQFGIILFPIFIVYL